MAPTESRLNVDTLSKRDVLLLFSVLEGELEARDVVIQALRTQCRDTFILERYGRFDLSDPFLALQRDSDALQDSSQGRGDGTNSTQRREANTRRSDPLTMLRLVVGHCRRMQEKMLKQLAAAESRHKRVIADLEEEKRRHAKDTAEGDDVTCILEKERERLLHQLEFEKSKFSRLEKENKKIQAQLEDERLQHKQLMVALGRECKRSGSRAHEEAQRANGLTLRLEHQRSVNQSLQAELEEQKKHAMQMEARREELLAEFDTEREQLSLRLRREEARSSALQEEVDKLRGEIREFRGEEERGSGCNQVGNGFVNGGTEKSDKCELTTNGHHAPVEDGGCNDFQTSSDQNALTNGSSSPSDLNTDSRANSPSSIQAAYQAGIQQRFHAVRHRFQSTTEQDPQPGSPLSHSPRDLSPCAITGPSGEASNSKQAARITVTQALSRLGTKTSPTPNGSPFGTDYRSVAPSGALSPGIRSPIIPRAERGIPPPIPPKKPGLAETPPSPATLRAAHIAQISVGCGRKSAENTKETDLLLSSRRCTPDNSKTIAQTIS
ncbi:CTTNBP2 N-terminal-like protein [Trichomycterus rosablanca]|uniref:CTTNBP2 N-terminal-like protein n=1 Tax=Trichomycterus rosablanca TaxID=2290929 RepID=UPI002F3573DE